MLSKFRVLRTCAVLTLAAIQALSSALLPSGKAPVAYAATQAPMSSVELIPSGPAYVTPGNNITYELMFKNLANQVMTNIVVFDPLPANTTYVNGGTFNSGANRVEFTLASLAPNTTHKFIFVVKVGSGVALGTVIENKNITVDNFALGPDSYGTAIDEAVGTTVEAAGTLVAVYKDTNGVPFNVSVDGYKFDNYSVAPAPAVGNDDLGADDMFALFGPKVCKSGTTAATCVLSGPAEKWRQKTLAEMAGGHCEGMAATSLRLFNWKPFKGKGSPASFQAGASTAIDLNFPAQTLENYIAYYWATQSVPEYWNEEIVMGPKELVNKMIADFNLPRPIPYTVAIVTQEGKHGHAIAAYGIETVNANESRILVYDNNYPKARKYIVVNMAANTWRYVTSATPGTSPTIYDGTATSGNLSIHPNDIRDRPAGQYYTCEFCSQPTRSASMGAASSETALASGVINFQYTGEGAILVIDDEGRSVGELTAGAFVNEIPNAELFDNRGGLGKDIPPRIAMPFTETDDTFYTVVVHGTTVTTPTHGTLSISGPGFHMGVDKIELDPSEVFTYTISPDGDHITFLASETVTAPTIHIAHDPIHAGDPSVIFDIADEILYAGESISLNLDPVHERIEFDDTGTEEEDFSVTMELIFPDGGVHVYTETVIVPVGAVSAVIDFGAWDGHLHAPIYIDNVLTNPSVDHRLKLDRVSGVYSSTPQPNAPAGVYRVEATFSNVTEVSLENVYFSVADLGAGNVVLNADGSPAGAKAKISVPAAALGSDGVLHTNESFTVSFDVGLASKITSTLTVNANGMPHDWIHPNPPPTYDANNASFVFAVRASNLYHLPVITR